jgi:O-antigen/teichoic acid export membrane protein
MNTAITTPAGNDPVTSQTAISRQIRGSSLLLIGRLLSLGLNFVMQVITVRYLSKSDYGAFAYALTVTSLGTFIAGFGLHKAVTVFIPVYHEQRDYDKVFGTIILTVGTILSLGLIFVVGVYSLRGYIGQSFVTNKEVIPLLLVMILGVPLQALDSLLIGMFAVFSKPRAIFFRKYLLAPGLQLVIVLLLIIMRSDVRFLAIGYLAASIFGVLICVLALVRELQNQGLLQYFSFHTIQYPAREVFGFTIPLLSTDLVFMLRSSLVVVLVEHFRGTVEVAAFRVVFPVAMLNMVVYQNFAYLFTPLASRMFVRNDRDGINQLYWQTAVWIAVISFPIFAVTFSLSRPLVDILYGERYEQSALTLSLLSLGYYFNAALGFNGLTLRIYRKLKYIVGVDLLGGIISLCIYLLLIRSYGAIGGAIATCGTLVIQNLFYQAGLGMGTDIKLFEWRWLKVYLAIALGAIGLLVIQVAISPYVYASFALAALVSLLVVRLNHNILGLGQMFPEFKHLPLAWLLIGQTPRNKQETCEGGIL